ncbi:MAG TPA: MBOAT family O-acyltransferase [Bacteroidales bacterium]|nr:MBOAT family O-acyltransferase [Bacteroidales bacterium]
MRPGRIFLFLLAVILVLSLLAILVKPGRVLNPHVVFPERVDTASVAESDTIYPVSRDSASITINSGTPEADTASSPAEAAQAGTLYPGDVVRDSLAAGRQVRIIFYGDSQIEGDRITSRLRKLMRVNGGGSGPGMISPLMPVLYTRSFVVKPSSNWTRYTLLDYKKGILAHNSLGPMLSVSRFTKAGDTPASVSKATVRITAVSGADDAVSRYDRLRILYGNSSDTTRVSVYAGIDPVAFTVLEKGTGPFEYSTALSSISDLTVEFTGKISPDIYALSLESDTGIVIDNIPVRGSAGLEFVMTDGKTFSETLAKLDPDLIVMQYGLNVVKNVRSEYHYYEEGLVRQIEYLRKASGGVPVVLMSLTDMAQKKGDTITTYRNIPAIRDAQRSAAERTGTVFWDAWETMGGEGSIVKWHDHVPALASKDYTHLSNAGADTIASRIYSALFLMKTVLPADDTTATAETADTAAEAVADSAATVPVTMAKKMERSGFLSRLRYNPQQSFIFTTPVFWIFFLVVLAGFVLLRKRRQMAHTWLLLVSVYFYYKAGGLFFILLLFTCAITYFTALLTGRAEGKGKKRFWLTVNIVVLLGLLSYFKYAGFFTESLNAILGTSFRTYDIFSAMSNSLFGSAFDVSQIVLPVGISFFTFQALSYSIDVYRGRIAPVNSFIDFSFYLTFFPQLVAGPIVRASEFIPQIKGEYTVTKNEFGHGVFLILQGLIKKMVISDFISAGFVDRVFDMPAMYSGFENLMAVYGYGLQIYCDFSGYTDIAIGAALLLGFRLPLNFNSPYKASNISDFWKRWHISLSRWLKDYLYIPLGGSRKGRIRTGINLMITMVLGGLWHGAALRFVLWGALHGGALIINRIWQRLFSGVKRQTFAARLAGIFVTFNFVTFAWILFRAESMDDATLMLSQIFNSFSPGEYGTVIAAYLPVIVLILSGYLLHFFPVTVKESYRGLFIRLPLAVKFIIVIGVCVLLYKVGSGVVQPFIYFRF